MTDDPQIGTIRARLAALRSGVRVWMAINGLSLLLVVLVTMAFVSLGIDYLAHMDLAQRAVLLILAIGTLGGLAYRRLVRPLLRPISDHGLCLEVEARRRELADRLITAVQLSELDDVAARTVSAAMVRRAVRDGNEAVSRLSFDDLLDHSQRNRRLAAGISAVAVLIIAMFALPQTMGLWFHRNVLLENTPWPRETTLNVLDARSGVISVAEGADFDLRVMASPDGVIPREVRAQSRPNDGGEIATRPLAKTEDNLFRTTYENIEEPFGFRVSGNDHTTQWFEVRVLDRPDLEELEIAVTRPDYVGGDTRMLPPGQSAYRVLKGSSVQIRGRSQKPLQRVLLRLGEKNIRDIVPEGQTVFGIRIPAGDLAGGRYGIHLKDTQGISIRRPVEFVLRLQADRKPDARAELQGIGGLILPAARLPVTARIRDDHGITAAWILCQTSSEDAEGTGERMELPGLTKRLDNAPSEIEHLGRLDMGDLELEPDTNVLLRLQARDNDQVSGPKVGESSTLSLRVVTPQELRAELLQREQELHQTFKRMLNDQKDLHESCRILRAEIGQNETISPPEQRSIVRLERGQRKMAQRAGELADQFAEIVAQVRNNRLEKEGGPIQKRLAQEIILPIRTLATDLNPRAAEYFREARSSGDVDLGASQGALERGQETQESILARMRQIQKSMVKSETIQEAINILRSILQKQRDLKEETEEERRESEENIFED